MRREGGPRCIKSHSPEQYQVCDEHPCHSGVPWNFYGACGQHCWHSVHTEWSMSLLRRFFFLRVKANSVRIHMPNLKPRHMHALTPLCDWHPWNLLQSGLTPLHLAAQEDRVNVAEVLVNQGAHVDAQTKVHLLSHSARKDPYQVALEWSTSVENLQPWQRQKTAQVLPAIDSNSIQGPGWSWRFRHSHLYRPKFFFSCVVIFCIITRNPATDLLPG